MSAEDEMRHPARMGGLVSGCARPWEVAYRQAAHPWNAWVPGVPRLVPVETTGPPWTVLART